MRNVTGGRLLMSCASVERWRLRRETMTRPERRAPDVLERSTRNTWRVDCSRIYPTWLEGSPEPRAGAALDREGLRRHAVVGRDLLNPLGDRVAMHGVVSAHGLQNQHVERAGNQLVGRSLVPTHNMLREVLTCADWVSSGKQSDGIPMVRRGGWA